MDNDLKGMTVSRNMEITGSSTINHNIRVALGLNCSEYVVLDYVYRMSSKGKPFSIDDMYRATGFTGLEQTTIARKLIVNGFIFAEDTNPPKMTSKFKDAFRSVEDEFEAEFWRDKGKVVWPGSKKKASTLYEKARLSYDKEFLIKSRNEYFEYLEAELKYNKFDRAKMAADRWLLPANEYYNTNWAELRDNILRKHDKPVKAEKTAATLPLTDEERRKFYEQDSNQ